MRRSLALSAALPWAVLPLALLAGCTSSPDGAPGATATGSVPGPSGGVPGGGMVIAPTMIDPATATVVSVPLGSMVVFEVADPAAWSATIADTGIATFQAGGDQGSYTTNPGLVPVAQGTTEVTATGPGDVSNTFALTVTAAVTDLVSPMPDLGITQETRDLADSLIGLSEADAVAAVEATGRTIRIARRDKESFALTMDYRSDRINIEVDAGVVTAVDIS